FARRQCPPLSVAVTSDVRQTSPPTSTFTRSLTIFFQASSTSTGIQATTHPSPPCRGSITARNRLAAFFVMQSLRKNLHWFHRHTTQSANLSVCRRSKRRPLRRAAH